MNAITVLTEGDGAFSDIGDNLEKVCHLRNPDITIARLRSGMESGASSVMIRINLPTGHIVLAEVSMANFLNCAAVFKAAEEI